MSSKFERLRFLFRDILVAQLRIPPVAVLAIVVGTSFFSISHSVTNYKYLRTYPLTPGAFDIKKSYSKTAGGEPKIFMIFMTA